MRTCTVPSGRRVSWRRHDRVELLEELVALVLEVVGVVARDDDPLDLLVERRDPGREVVDLADRPRTWLSASATSVESWPESRENRAASVWASASTAVRAALEPGSDVRSSQADQKRDSTVPRPEPDGSGNAASTADRVLSRADQ